MSAEESELYTAFCDFDINENSEIDKDINYKYNSYEETEIDTDDFQLKDVDTSVLGERVMENTFVPLQFVDEESIPLVHEEKSVKKKPCFVCESCGKKYVKETFFVKHISKCQVDNEERPEEQMDTDEQEADQDLF